MRTLRTLLAAAPLVLAACGGGDAEVAPPTTPAAPRTAPPATAAAPAPPAKTYDGLARAELNRRAARLNLPLFWAADADGDKSVDPNEVVTLAFYPTAVQWVDAGKFTPAFDEAYARLTRDVAPAGLAANEAERRSLVAQDLDQGTPTLIRSDMSSLSADEKAFVKHIYSATRLIDTLYATQRGNAGLDAQIPADDTASQSLFRRNWGPRCLAPKTEKNPACSAIPGAPKVPVDVYPKDLQKDPKFCEALEKGPNAKKLMSPFVVVRAAADGKPGKDGKPVLEAVPYSDAYRAPMLAISEELKAAASTLGEKESALKAYVLAAAQSFLDNNWTPADEAWSKMTATNSKFYLRIAADETYWEPCAQKAGFHVTFARINPESLKWQEKFTPVQQEMEKALAAHIGGPYKERKVTFHLPDFIDIVWNAGDDRNALGATIGQSLPNWGPVTADGRGRTVAMNNLYTSPDTLAVRRKQAESLLVKESMSAYVDDANPGLLGTILHELTHNLGPAHEYKTPGGKTDAQAFGGGLASMMEELKAQSGALYFTEFSRKHGIVDDELAKRSYADSVVWAFGHISRGMYTETGGRKAYSQLAAIQIGFLMDEKAITFDADATAANGTDKGAFSIHFDKLVPAIDKLMKKVGTLKATGDKASAEALAKRYVDGTVVPQKVIAERVLRFPGASFVYAFDL